MATAKGLLCFDGYETKTYRHDKNTPHSLPDNEVTNIKVDGKGFIWLITGDGLSRFDPSTELFKRIELSKAIFGSLHSPDFTSLNINDNDEVWVRAMTIKKSALKTAVYAKSIKFKRYKPG